MTKALILDDERDICELIEMSLMGQDITCTSVYTIRAAIKALKDAMDNGSVADINSKTEALTKAAEPVLQKAYNKMSGEQAAGGGSTGSSSDSAPKDDNVVDADFQEVKDDK